MQTKTLKLKKWVTVSIYLSLITIVFMSMVFISKLMDSKYSEPLNLSYILRNIIEEDIPVISYEEDSIIKPYATETVTIAIDYYDKDSDEETQKNSLILYENTYMPNTGILYTNEDQFDIYATLEGTITKVGKEELLGNYIEITHSSSLVITYYSVDNVNVIEGQVVKQGDIIATSGLNKISSISNNMLLFEVSLNGKNIDPENYYKLKIEDLEQ